MDGGLKSLIGQVFDDSASPFVVTTIEDDPAGGTIVYANGAFDEARRSLAARPACGTYRDALLGMQNLVALPAGGFAADVVLAGRRRARVEAVALSDAGSPPGLMMLSHRLGDVRQDDPVIGESIRSANCLVAGIAAGIVVHRDFHLLFANRPAAALLERCDDGRRELPSTLFAYLPADSLAQVLERHVALLSGKPGKPPCPVRLITGEGRETWVEIGAGLLEGGNGPVVVWTLTDANAQVQARAHEALLRDAVDNLNDSFILYDASDRVVLTNKRFHETFPYLAPQDEIAGKAMVELVRTSVDSGAVTDPTLCDMAEEAWIEKFVTARRINKMMLSEDTWPDGRWDLVKEQRLDSGGFVSVRTDITDRKHAEFALKDQEARLELALAERTKHLSAVLSNVAQGVLVLDPELRVVLTNQGFHDLLDCPRRMGIPGTPVRDLIADRMARGYMFPEELESDADQATLVERRLESYKPLAREQFRQIMVGDKTLEVAREKLSDGTTICTYTDITGRLRAEHEVERQREALHQSEKLSALGMLLAGVAHELNNPLQVVLGNAALLEDDTADRDQAKRAATIRDAAERCAKIIKTFLAMARNAPASKQQIDLNDLIRRSLSLIGYQLRSKDIAVELDLSPTLERVVGDADQISQVIVNLLLNAMQAIEQAAATRSISVRTRNRHADRLIEFEVCDTGPGVPQDIRGRIFDPFFTTKPVGLGTGIGLAVCHGMVAAHNGSISVDEAPGGGARFVISLPWGSGAGNDAEPGPRYDRADLSGRVLVVDDEHEIRELLFDILESTGLEVEMAASGREALQLIASRPYAAILCDLRMPDMDGPGLYGEVARRAPDALERFIFATGDLLNEAADSFLTQAARPYLAKPFLPEQVRHVVTNVAAGRK